MTRIIIIDDHKLFSDGLAALLEKDANFAVIAQIYDSREALSKVNELKSDLVIADFNMPYINGLSLTKILLAANPDLKILILSMYNEERFVKDFKDAGAMGYLTKTTEIQEVKQGILAIVSGKSVFPQLVTNQDSIYNQDLFLKKFSLSLREKEVVD